MRTGDQAWRVQLVGERTSHVHSSGASGFIFDADGEAEDRRWLLGAQAQLVYWCMCRYVGMRLE